MDSKSTGTDAQRERIIEALRLRPHTSYDLRRLGIYQAPARVKELRDRFGYSITTDPVVIVDRDGYRHGNSHGNDYDAANDLCLACLQRARRHDRVDGYRG